MAKSNLHRVDENRLTVSNDFDVDVSLFANADVPVEQIAVDELQRMLELQQTVEALPRPVQRALPRHQGSRGLLSRQTFIKLKGFRLGRFLKPAVLWSRKQSATMLIVGCDCT